MSPPPSSPVEEEDDNAPPAFRGGPKIFASNIPSNYPQTVSPMEERTYAQKIRDEFYKNELLRLPGILQQVEERLTEAERDKYGEFRGLAIFREKRLPRNTSAKSAKLHLRSLITKRHALRHGFHKLHQMVRHNKLGKSIMGRETNQVLNVHEARDILIQFWCYGRSQLYEHLQQEEYLRGLNKDDSDGNVKPREIKFLTKIDVRQQIADDFANELRRKIPVLRTKT